MNCRYCGAGLLPGALFCGECGRTVEGDGAPRRRRPVLPEPAREPAPQPTSEATSESAGTETLPRQAEAEPDSADPGHSGDTRSLPEPFDVVGRLQSVPSDAEASEAASGETSSTVPDTRPPAAQYVFRFSTGESVVVDGSGLIGRRPVTEPGESVDRLVVVGDVGKSVSKTHLEFGQADGELWISDRYSTNGTVLRTPDGLERSCLPGRRYRLPRGSRVALGEQFFVVD